jgi:hypothetical protein
VRYGKKNKVSIDSSQCLSSPQEEGGREGRPGASGSGSIQEIVKRVFVSPVSSGAHDWAERGRGTEGSLFHL